MINSIYLSAMGMVCALGNSHEQIIANLLRGSRDGMVEDDQIIDGKKLRLGRVSGDLSEFPIKNPLEQSRNNQLLLAALKPISNEVERLIEKYGKRRIGLILGTSTSGTLEAECAMDRHLKENDFPNGYDFRVQEMGDPSRFLANYLSLTGPAYTVSTACSSSGKVFASARNLIRSGVCDAVIVGGADSLCRLTVHGFSALESVSDEHCQPFSANRDGINLGEGAALFTLTADQGDIKLLGVGESSDAWHISAPHPEGRGAKKAMLAALEDACLNPDDIGYLNLHGTATPLNDAMESQAVSQVFATPVSCSSTKTMTGHTLGAAGAVEAGLTWLLLSELNSQRQLPPHICDNTSDKDIPELNLVDPKAPIHLNPPRIMSNSFAFGGSNVSIILGK